jgi:CheY-like chemotaxis protein
MPRDSLSSNAHDASGFEKRVRVFPMAQGIDVRDNDRLRVASTALCSTIGRNVMPEQMSGRGSASLLSRPTPPVHRLGGEPKVMLVEDHEDTREFMQVLFENAGFLVTDRQYGIDAVDTIMRTRPDVVLLNGYLRGEDGWSICRKLRNAEDLGIRDTPVIFIATARGDGETKAFAAGCDVFVLKPFDVDELVEAVTALIARRCTVH